MSRDVDHLTLAEAQEALRLEASLERVRAITLAMDTSDELRDASLVYCDRLVELGLNVHWVNYVLYDEANDTWQLWLAYSEAYPLERLRGKVFTVDLPEVTDDPILDAWRAGDRHRLTHIAQDALPGWAERYRSLFELTGQDVQEILPSYPNGFFRSDAFMRFGLLAAGADRPFSKAEIDTHCRFAVEFERTYQRFLDLQRAEAQAREAEIELAMERIRAAGLAMNRSEELVDVAEVLWTQFETLGIAEKQHVMVTEEHREDGYWEGHFFAVDPSTPDLAPGPGKITRSTIDTYHARDVFRQKDEGKTSIETVLEGDVLTEFIEELVYEPIRPVFRSLGIERFYHNFAVFSGGMVTLGSLEPIAPESQQVLVRAAAAFDLAWRRYKDLQKAEAQAREAQIEAAVERVRGRALAMHSSEELNAVVEVMRDQMTGLGLENVTGSTIMIVGDDGLVTMWDQSAPGNLGEPGPNHWVFDPLARPQIGEGWRLWSEGMEYFVQEFDPERIQLTLKEIAEVAPDHVGVIEEAVETGHLKTQWIAAGSFSAGYLSVDLTQPPGEWARPILTRMAGAFDVAWRRFGDLQKAEAQAREAQVEAAVERIRGKALAMHRSEDVYSVAVNLREEMLGLGIQGVSAGSVFLRQPDGRYRMWDITTLEDFTETSAHASDVLLDLTQIPPEVHLHEVLGFAGSYNVVSSGPKELLVTADWFGTNYNPTLGKELREAVETGVMTGAWFPAVPIEGGRMSIDMLVEPPAEMEQILPRFASAFELAYRRFEDLQQAEAQAREAKIEAALERVRAAAMAMHSAEDIAAASIILFDELNGLGITPLRSGISIPMDGDRYEFWAAAQKEDGESTRVIGSESVNVHPIIRRAYDGWKQQEKYQTAVLEGEELVDYYHAVFDTMPLPNWQERMKTGAAGREDFATFPFSDGWLYLFNKEPLTEAELETVLRFTQVFDLTYRRYLDLKQAEARALESRRDASVDRVRAEIASMRTTEDLERITPLVWRELETLGVSFDRCGVFIMDEEAEVTRVYLSRPDGSPIAAMEIPFSLPGLSSNAVTYWRERQVYTDMWDREQLAEWSRSMKEGGYVPEGYIPSLPDKLALHFVPFEQGVLYVGSEGILAAEQIGLIQALADAFTVAYARYDDFQRLEAAKAQAEAALTELRATQKQLVEQEKLASLGQLTAGIAHEIKNPLNFVNNFAEVSAELADEAREALESGDVEAARRVLSDLGANSAQITKHGKRADEIVKAMMQHARGGDATRETVDLNAFVEEYVNLAWHGMRARRHGFQVDIEREYADEAGSVQVLPQEIGRVLVNLLNNAFDALTDTEAAVVAVSTGRSNGQVEIRIGDNGPGIPEEVRERIFEPFFTTKATGEGTGLGLSLSYDIVTKGHRGEMMVRDSAQGGAEFVIRLPA